MMMHMRQVCFLLLASFGVALFWAGCLLYGAAGRRLFDDVVCAMERFRP